MSRDANGNYTLPTGNPVITGNTIESSWANDTMSDLASEITNSLDRFGKGGMAAPLRNIDGSMTIPSMSFTNETNTGFYRAATGDIRLSIRNKDAMKVLEDAKLEVLQGVYTFNGNGLFQETNKLFVGIDATAPEVFTTDNVSAYAQTLLDDADAAAARATLGISTFGSSLIDDADATAARTTLGLGTAAVANISSYGASLIDDADATAARTTLGLGTAAVKNVNDMGDIVVSGFTSTGIDDNANATSITIGANGKVGIGVGAGFSTLSVQKDIAIGGTSPFISLSEDASGSDTPTYIQRNSATGAMDIFNSGISGNGIIRFLPGDGSEKVRITAGGGLLVGMTISSIANQGFAVDDDGLTLMTTYGGRTCIMSRYTDDGEVLQFRRSGTATGSISVTSSATSYNTSSDYRLKEDVKPIANASEKVLSLNPVDAAWKIDGTRVQTFLAHEYGEVVTGGATGVKDGMRIETYEITPADDENEAVMGEREVPDFQGIDLSKAVPLLTASLQDALKRIAILEGA